MRNKETLKSDMENSEYEIQIIDTLEGIESIRPLWEKMIAVESCPTVNSDVDRYVAVLQGISQAEPCLFLMWLNNQLQAMVIGRLDRVEIPLKFGYKTITSCKVKCLSVIYGGILGQPDEKIGLTLLRVLRKFLRQKSIDCICFNHLRTDSQFCQKIYNAVPFLCRNHFLTIEPHWITELPESVERFQGNLSQKRRHELKRVARKLEKDSGFKIEVRELYAENQVDTYLNIAETISSKSYKYALNAGVKNDFLTRNCICKDIQLRRWRGYVLYVGDEPCAFQSGVILNNIFFVETIGYDSKWTDYSPGKLLLIKVFEHFCETKEVCTVDFGFGDAIYKQMFCSKSWSEVKAIYVFACRFYPLLLNGVISLNGALTQGLVLIVKKLGVYAWFKRLWRRTLKNTKNER